MSEMKFSDIYTSVVETFKRTNEVAIMIMGRPGGGKTALAKKVGRDLEFDHVELFYASLRDTVDLLGTPVNSGETTVWKPPAELYRLRKGRNLLVLDEMSDASTPMQNALCSLIHERRINDLVLSPQTYILATGNRTEDKSGANRLISKLANRVRFLDFIENLDDWCEWALGAGIDPMLIQFLRFKPNLLSQFDPNNRCNPTPRAWERVNLVPDNLPSDVYFANCAGEVGEGAAAEWTAFRRIAASMISPDEVLLNPTGVEVPSDPAVLYALTGALAHRTSKDNFDRMYEFIRRLPADFQVMYVNDAQKLKPEVKSTKAFVKWAVENGNVLI